MQRLGAYTTLAIVAGIACLWAAWRIAARGSSLPRERIFQSFRDGGDHHTLTIRYPLDGTLFPPDIVPPTFTWEDESPADAWVLAIELDAESSEHRPSKTKTESCLTFECAAPHWTPTDDQWEQIKRSSTLHAATVTVIGVHRRSPERVVSAATLRIATSKDPVAAPIFYREVGLPFADAVRDTAAHIRWRFGDISSKQQPPVVLEKLPVCANCHSFSNDGQTLGMDVDYANDHGSYAIDAVAKEITLRPEKIITWSDFRREDNETTFGLLSQVSPDGRYVVSTVKDQSVFVPRDDLAFSQLFFPIKGILAVYDRENKEFHALPGADDPSLVQSNPAWSPDGKTIVFARSKAYQPRRRLRRNVILLRQEDCDEFLSGRQGFQFGRQGFQFDLYRIPFNEGRGGKAEPLAGASHNGMSNYFARYSPDGKWIVFCKAKNFMLLQPDSELWIVPAQGGQARRLECNTPRMNSWHSWSPNGRWLVFSSKWHTPFTQLFLTHIDEQGRSSPPVLLAHFTAPDCAANIPEFVRAEPSAIEKIREQFIDDTYYARSGDVARLQGDHEVALRDYQRALALNPDNVQAHVGLGSSLTQLGRVDEAIAYFRRAITLDPRNPQAHDGLGNLLAQQGRRNDAAAEFREALRLDPTLASACCRLGLVLLDLGELDEAAQCLDEAVRSEPMDARAHCALGVVFARKGNLRLAVQHYRWALAIDARLIVALTDLASILATSADAALRNGKEAVELARRACQWTAYRDLAALLALSESLAEVGQFADAIATAERIVELAGPGQQAIADAARKHLASYRQGLPWRREPASAEAAPLP